MARGAGIRGILFDKDGTLLDYHRTWMPLNRRAAEELAGGDAVETERLLALAGYDAASGRVRSGSPLAAWANAEIAALWAEALGRSDEAGLAAWLDGLFASGGAESAAPVTDLGALMTGLKGRGLKLGVATSDSHAGALATLGGFNVVELLDFVAGYDSGHGRKPDPGMVLGFCAAVGLEPAAVAMVGDNSHDLHMARAAGCGLAVGVLTGTSSREELAPLADHVLEDVTGLEALLFEA